MLLQIKRNIGNYKTQYLHNRRTLYFIKNVQGTNKE